MTRPLRIEFPGALYHVTARGDRRAAIYADDADRLEWLSILAQVCARFNFIVPAYCEMVNHYHFMVETPDGNLSQGMRRLNSVYSQYFNRRHRQVGHVFQGRYKAILVQKQSYLLELARYIVLNPVRAQHVKLAEDWGWSSHKAMLGKTPAPGWLDTGWLLTQFGGTRATACAAYQQFVATGVGAVSPLRKVRHQFILGDEDFIARHVHPSAAASLTAVCRTQRRATALALEDYAAQYPDREHAMAAAYFSTAFTMLEIGKYFRVSYQTVSRAVKRHESKFR